MENVNVDKTLDRAIFKVKEERVAEFIGQILKYHISDDTIELKRMPGENEYVRIFLESAKSSESSAVISILSDIRKGEI